MLKLISSDMEHLRGWKETTSTFLKSAEPTFIFRNPLTWKDFFSAPEPDGGFGMSRLSPRFHLRRISFMFFRSASHNEARSPVSAGETVQRASNCKQLPSARAFISWYVSLPFTLGRLVFARRNQLFYCCPVGWVQTIRLHCNQVFVGRNLSINS